MSTILESRKYKKKELYPLLGYSKAPVGGSKKTFERKLTDCCKWNTENCKTTEINVIEVYKQPLETKFEHGLIGNTNATNKKGKVYWEENSNSQLVAGILLNKIEYFTNKKNDFVTIGVFAKKCGLYSEDVQTQNHINTEIRRNIHKLKKLNLIKVQVKYNASLHRGKLTEISEKEYNDFKNISNNIWKQVGGNLVKSFNSFYQFYNVFSDNDYKDSIISTYIEALKKDTSFIYVFESYKLEFNYSEYEECTKIAVKLNELLLDEDIIIQDKITNYIEELEEHYKEKALEKQNRVEQQHKPTGFGNGFIFFTEKMYQKIYAAANNVAVF